MMENNSDGDGESGFTRKRRRRNETRTKRHFHPKVRKFTYSISPPQSPPLKHSSSSSSLSWLSSLINRNRESTK